MICQCFVLKKFPHCGCHPFNMTWSLDLVYSPSGFSDHGILQAKILEWVLFPSPGDLPIPGIKSRFPALQADSSLTEPPREPTLAAT